MIQNRPHASLKILHYLDEGTAGINDLGRRAAPIGLPHHSRPRPHVVGWLVDLASHRQLGVQLENENRIGRQDAGVVPALQSREPPGEGSGLGSEQLRDAGSDQFPILRDWVSLADPNAARDRVAAEPAV